MKVAQMSWVRREFVYFLLCGLAGFVVLPGILVFVGTWLMHHGTWFPEVWPSSFLEGYLAFFSLMWLRIQRGHLLMPLAEILVCFLVPYTLFQLARWSIRGIRSVRTRVGARPFWPACRLLQRDYGGRCEIFGFVSAYSSPV